MLLLLALLLIGLFLLAPLLLLALAPFLLLDACALGLLRTQTILFLLSLFVLL